MRLVPEQNAALASVVLVSAVLRTVAGAVTETAPSVAVTVEVPEPSSPTQTAADARTVHGAADSLNGTAGDGHAAACSAVAAATDACVPPASAAAVSVSALSASESAALPMVREAPDGTSMPA